MGWRGARAWRSRGLALLMVCTVPAAGAVAVLVVTETPAGATTVGTESAFRTAFVDPSETSITLSADVHLTDGAGGCGGSASPAVRSSTTALTIDGAGHTIFQDCPELPILSLSDTGALNVTISTWSKVPWGSIREVRSRSLTR